MQPISSALSKRMRSSSSTPFENVKKPQNVSERKRMGKNSSSSNSASLAHLTPFYNVFDAVSELSLPVLALSIALLPHLAQDNPPSQSPSPSLPVPHKKRMPSVHSKAFWSRKKLGQLLIHPNLTLKTIPQRM